MSALLQPEFVIYCLGGYSYRIRPNPDGETVDGTDGIEVMYSDNGAEPGENGITLFVQDDALRPLAAALQHYINMQDKKGG